MTITVKVHNHRIELPPYVAVREGAEVRVTLPDETAPDARAAVLRAELDSLMLDCHKPGWDGHGADAVSVEAYNAATRFIGSLPAGITRPDLSADPHGCVTFEWRESPERVLLVSVQPGAALDYAALLGGAKTHGSEPFTGDLPETLANLIGRVAAG